MKNEKKPEAQSNEEGVDPAFMAEGVQTEQSVKLMLD